MAQSPTIFRNRPRATSIEDDDIFLISKMVNGAAKTMSIAWEDVIALVISDVNAARQALVDANNATQQEIQSAVSMLSEHQGDIDAMQQAMGQRIQDISNLQTGMSNRVTDIATLQASLAAQTAQLQSILDQMALKKTVVTLPDVTVPAAALISLTSGEKTFAALSCPGVKPTDALAITPKTGSIGYGFRGYSIPANDQITLKLQIPILSVGGVAQVFGVVAFR